jgi:FkbM family methyltransferase
MADQTGISSLRGSSFQYVYNTDYEASWYTFSDEQDVREALWDIKPGDVILDVGCGLGSYAMSAMALGAARADCWTPITSEQVYFQKSLVLNKWDQKVFVFPTGLWDRPGWLKILLNEQGGPIGREFHEKEVEGSFRVDTIDNLMNKLLIYAKGPRYWLKIDTEGAEPEILKGGVEFLRRNRPMILVENHDFCRPNATAIVQEFLESEGYKLQMHRPRFTISHSLFVPVN